MSGMMMMFAGGSNGGVVQPFTAWTCGGNQSAGISSTSTSKFNWYSTGAVDDAGGPNNTSNNVPGSPNWYSPTTTGAGASYYIRFTLNSGLQPQTGPAAGVWTSLASTVTWALSNTSTTGSSSCNCTISIATDAAGSNIVFTSAGNIMQAQHTM